MKQNLILLFVLIQFISCNSNKEKNIVDENCYIVLNSVASVIDVSEKRDICLTQMINEVKNGAKIDTKNVGKIQMLSKEINARLSVSLKNLKTEFAKNKSEKIFDISIQYLLKIKEMEKQFPMLISDLSDDVPENNGRFSNSILKSTKEVEKFYLLYSNAMNKYFRVHNMSEKKIKSIQAAIQKKTKHSKYITSS